MYCFLNDYSMLLINRIFPTQKWMFSTAIAPISGWTMDSDNAVAEHLRICPFNERLDHGTEPFQCIFLNQDATMMMQRQRP